jgi:hypothetical protein
MLSEKTGEGDNGRVTLRLPPTFEEAKTFQTSHDARDQDFFCKTSVEHQQDGGNQQY